MMRRLFGSLLSVTQSPAQALGPAMPLLEPRQLVGAANRTEVESAIRARCQILPLDSERVVCRVLGRYKFIVDRADLGLSVHLMLDGYWEFWCTDFILRHLKPGQVAFDVGANLGYYAVLMAEAVGPAGHVHAIEPNPHMADLVAQNLALNGMTGMSSLHRAAVHSHSGAQLRFLAPPREPKNGHVLPADSAPEPGEYAVTSLCLDDLAGRPAHFLKVDVEGAEEKVWAGMQRLLDISPEVILLMEFNAFRCADAPGLLAAIAARFPLRELNLHAHVVPCAAAELLGRTEDTLLLLTNRPQLEKLREK
jgi:FkbM family methyltransferase